MSKSQYHEAVNAARWQRTRKTVFARDRYRCRACGGRGRLECDHIVPLHVDPDQDYYDPNGCQALCRNCHLLKTADENRRRPRPERPDPERDAWRRLVEGLFG
ncbi:MAG: HNH endonuclease [Gammaproteobacteria bacterium]|nr:HNH endonuclease [Gammaproteobacteria bacterium]